MFGNGNISIKINGDASNFERAVNKSIGLSKSFAGAIGVAFSATAAIAITKQLIEISDRYTQLDGRLRLVTKSTADFQAAQAGLYKIAQDTRVEYEATADLYTRIARSTDNLGLSQKDLLGITESINKALIVSGASGESASAALMQLGQGMASGALRGEELNSVMEQTPRLAQMIADGLGVGIGQLREMGKEGKITSEVLIGALQRGAASVNDSSRECQRRLGRR
jgi:tape measure domain-containing protein